MAKWNLNDIYKEKDEKKLIEDLKKKASEFETFRNELNKDLSVRRFLEIFKKKEEIFEICTKLEVRSHIKLLENTSDSRNLAHHAKISEIVTDVGNKIMFFSLWFKNLNEEDAKKFINASGKYKYFFHLLRLYKKYTLTEKEEKIINLLALTGDEALVKLYNIQTDQFLFNWGGKKITQEKLLSYVTHHNKNYRKKAYDLLLKKYKENQSLLGEIYKNIVLSWRNEEIKLRGFKEPISPRNLGNDLPDDLVIMLLDVIRENRTLFQQYFRLKAKLLNLKKLRRYDIYSPYSKVHKKFSYETAKKITLEIYGKFSKKLQNFAKMVFDKKHVDWEIRPKKKSGARCISSLVTILPYVQLNHAGRFEDLSTMMHELGHAIHSISAFKQTNFTFHASLPMAETASLFGETLLTKRMLKELKDRNERISILMRMIEREFASILRQAYFVLFEIKAHKLIAEGVTLEELNKAYFQLLREQFGDSIDIDNIFMYEWLYIPHIFESPFYCYAYAFGNLLVLSLFRMYEKQGRKFVPKYMKILEAGGSDNPVNICKKAGIDIRKRKFWESGFDIIKEQIKELEKLSGL